jgi:4'-phosphopantetheinyl transferase EntD
MALADLFPTPVSCRELFVAGDPATLLPAEAACAVGFAERRLREFAAGRLCARLALAELGVLNLPLLVGPAREPLWPDGFTGSITHADRYCAAAVCRAEDIVSLGIDAESIDQVDRSVWPVLFRAVEIEWLESLPKLEQDLMACALFSGKEAYFKCQFQLTRSWVDFHDVELRFGAGTFAVLRDGGETPYRVAGAYRVESETGIVITTVVARRLAATDSLA